MDHFGKIVNNHSYRQSETAHYLNVRTAYKQIYWDQMGNGESKKIVYKTLIRHAEIPINFINNGVSYCKRIEAC